MGLHFVNFSLVADGQLDATHPELVIYEPLPSGHLKLTGAEFLVLKDQWDAAHAEPPQLMGQLFHLNEAPNRYRLPAFYSLHVWAWKENPFGAFVNWHPHVSCEGFSGGACHAAAGSRRGHDHLKNRKGGKRHDGERSGMARNRERGCPETAPQELKELMSRPDVVLVDVRDAPEVQQSGNSGARATSRAACWNSAPIGARRITIPRCRRTERWSCTAPRADARHWLRRRCSTWATRRCTTPAGSRNSRRPDRNGAGVRLSVRFVFLAFCMAGGLASSSERVPAGDDAHRQIGSLNHFWAALDDETARAIVTSDYLKSFAHVVVNTVTAAGNRQWTGRYLRGRQTYAELFSVADLVASGAPARIGASGIGISGDTPGVWTLSSNGFGQRASRPQ